MVMALAVNEPKALEEIFRPPPEPHKGGGWVRDGAGWRYSKG